MLTRRQLLTAAGVIECLTGLALMLAPGPTLLVLVGAKADGVGLMIGPLAGLALAALGICCLEETLKGITFYNAGAGLYLVFLAASGRAFGVVVWIAGLLHLGLAAQYALERRTRR